ncbi:MAG TPA: YegS/Rv2252/BmrU family lipid kinase [Chitinophagales bacterium]|nr:YegS/Rv2252/BmrU family lipid kinase [Chitinophagales bacterium]
MAKPIITFVLYYKIKSVSSLKAEIEASFSKDYTVQYKTTDKSSGSKNSVKAAIVEKSDIIIICGGDGSINEAVNEYLSTKSSLPITWGVLPMGTGNDFAKSLGVKNSIKELKSLINRKKTMGVSIFKMKFIDRNQNASSRYYINIADIGLGGHVAQSACNSSKLLGPNITYIKAIVSSFLKFKKQPVQLISDSFEWEGDVMSLCMANGKYFGSGMCVAPDADISDDQLQLAIFGDISILDYLKNLSKVKKGIKIAHPEVIYTAVSGCKVASKGIPCPIDMDGEFIGYTPLEVELEERKMRFYGEV